MEIPKTQYYKTPDYSRPRRPMPKIVSDCLKSLGLDRKQRETAKDQADRCKAYLRETGLMTTLPEHIQA